VSAVRSVREYPQDGPPEVARRDEKPDVVTGDFREDDALTYDMDPKPSQGAPSVDRPDGTRVPPVPREVVSIPLPLSRPLWTYVLIGVNLVVWLAMTLAGGSEDPRVLLRFGVKANWLIVEGEYWRFVTPSFLHIGFWHLAINTWSLFVLGMDVERLFGAGRFLALYLLSGVAAVVASCAASDAMSAGASGAIFGLLGATLVYFAKNHKFLGNWGHQRLRSLVMVTAINLIWGLAAPGIDNVGHIGGLLSGLALGWAYCPRYRLVPSATFPWQPSLADEPLWSAIVGGTVGVIIFLFGLAMFGIWRWELVYAAL